MDVVNSEVSNSSNHGHSSEHGQKVVLDDKSDEHERVVKSNVELKENWKINENRDSVENDLDKTFGEENRKPLRKESALKDDFTELDKSYVNFEDECERAKLLKLAKSSKGKPEELGNGASQANRISDEAFTENEENFPKESSSERDSIDLEQRATMDHSDSKKHFLSINDIQDFIDSRVAEARLEVVENKIDRVLMKIENIKNDQQRQLFHVLLARIKELEDKLDKKTVVTKKGNPLSGLPVEQFSSYVVEKATQTPSEEHDCEGVYVLVSKKNKQQVRQVHRQAANVLPGDSSERSKNVEESQPKHPQPKVAKKVIKPVGYPEYSFEESLQGHKVGSEWNKLERKTVAFFPPIPSPYSRRRPRNVKYQENTGSTNCSKHH